MVNKLKSKSSDLLKTALSHLHLEEIGIFQKDTFGTAGPELVTAVSVLSKTKLIDVVEHIQVGFYISLPQPRAAFRKIS